LHLLLDFCLHEGLNIVADTFPLFLLVQLLYVMQKSFVVIEVLVGILHKLGTSISYKFNIFVFLKSKRPLMWNLR
jgi:hypothetical protein